MKRIFLSFFGVCVLMLFCLPHVSARTPLPCSETVSPGVAQNIVNAAAPGDVICITNGSYSNVPLTFSAKGTSDKPITVRAQSVGGVTFKGSSRLTITGEYLTIEGFNYIGGSLQEKQDIILFTPTAHYNRITHFKIDNYNPTNSSVSYDWISIAGTHNRIDHSELSNKKHPGSLIKIERAKNTGDYHQIDHNYLHDVPTAGGTNGFDGIQIGNGNEFCTIPSHIIIENNLFERLKGENEIVSVKGSQVTFRNNTIRDSATLFSLRSGHDSIVDGNYFINQPRGVSVSGHNHVLTNNHFYNITHDAIQLSAGSSQTESKTTCKAGEAFYWAAHDAIVADNCFEKIGAQNIVSNLRYGTEHAGFTYDIRITGLKESNNSCSSVNLSEALSKNSPGIGLNPDDILEPTLAPTAISTPTSSPCGTGDIDCSGKVNAADHSILLLHFGSSNILADLDESGKVNAADLTILLQNFGS